MSFISNAIKNTFSKEEKNLDLNSGWFDVNKEEQIYVTREEFEKFKAEMLEENKKIKKEIIADHKSSLEEIEKLKKENTKLQEEINQNKIIYEREKNKLIRTNIPFPFTAEHPYSINKFFNRPKVI